MVRRTGHRCRVRAERAAAAAARPPRLQSAAAAAAIQTGRPRGRRCVPPPSGGAPRGSRCSRPGRTPAHRVSAPRCSTLGASFRERRRCPLAGRPGAQARVKRRLERQRGSGAHRCKHVQHPRAGFGVPRGTRRARCHLAEPSLAHRSVVLAGARDAGRHSLGHGCQLLGRHDAVGEPNPLRLGLPRPERRQGRGALRPAAPRTPPRPAAAAPAPSSAALARPAPQPACGTSRRCWRRARKTWRLPPRAQCRTRRPAAGRAQ